MSEERYQNALNWITTWLNARNPQAVVLPGTRFYADGLIDSFAIVELISEAEEEFSVLFSSEQLSSPAFQTVGGFAEAIARPSIAA